MILRKSDVALAKLPPRHRYPLAKQFAKLDEQLADIVAMLDNIHQLKMIIKANLGEEALPH